MICWVILGQNGPKMYCILAFRAEFFLNPPKKCFSKNMFFFHFSIFIEFLVKNWSRESREKIENKLAHYVPTHVHSKLSSETYQYVR